MSISLPLNEILFEIEMHKPSIVDFGGVLLNWEKVEERITDFRYICWSSSLPREIKAFPLISF